MPGFRHFRRLPPSGLRRGWLSAALCLCVLSQTAQGQTGIAQTLAPPAAPTDLTDLPLEQLLDTRSVSAAHFARHLTDAASAVSVLTREEIQRYGLRTLGEALDHLRGVHVRHSLDYVLLGARGLSGNGFASQVLMLVDGNPPPDNLYDQLYLGRDALVDIDLVERIEWAPGSGSALYGQNALLGVVNVITRRGRDLDGLELSTTLGDWQQRSWRVSSGGRRPGGLEWLASISGHADSALPSAQIGDQLEHRDAHAQTTLLKLQWQGWFGTLMTSRRRVEVDALGTADGSRSSEFDRNELAAIGHDSRPAPDWRLSLRLQAGRYDFRYGDTGVYRQVDSGRWWALESQATYEGWAGHRIAVGGQLRRDPTQSFTWIDEVGQPHAWRDSQRLLGLSVQDEIAVGETLRLTLGARSDQHDDAPRTFSPRMAAVWKLTPGWELKAAHGQSTRWLSASEESVGDQPPGTEGHQRQRADTDELLTEYRSPHLRALGALYRFQLENDWQPATSGGRLRGRGAELELEWQDRGWQVRGSHSWQRLQDGGLMPAPYAPARLAKLMLSAPLATEGLRLSTALRHTGAFHNYAGRVPARSLLDLTLLAPRVAGGLDLRIGLRNLLRKREAATDEYYAEPPQGYATRFAWVELSGAFR